MQSLQLMLNELESHQLQTILVPLNPRLRNWNEFGCKRVNVDTPPAWYRRLCQKHSSSRGIRKGKQDTRIRRQNILQVLRRLAKTGAPLNRKYDAELMRIARERMKNIPAPR